MSRIRSIHPGLFTDEAFMTASVHARMLVIGLWTEAWDDGVFEWKPMTLKARLFPVDAVDIQELLTELDGLGFICRFTCADGKNYGAIRNFRKWQRPKTPNASGVLPDEFRKYVGFKGDELEDISEPFPKHFGNASEKCPQREDVGGRREDVEESPQGKPAGPIFRFDEFYDAYPKHVDRAGAERKYAAAIKTGVSHEDIVAGAKRYAVRCVSEKTEARFIKSPEAWLNKGCWADEGVNLSKVLPAGNDFRKIGPDHRLWEFAVERWRQEHGKDPPRIEWSFPISYFSKASEVA